MDYMNKENHYARHSGTVNGIMEQGRQQFREEVLSPLMGKLKDTDPGWEPWYDETIPEGSSLKVIAQLVQEHIDEITNLVNEDREMDELERISEDERDHRETTRSIISTFYPF